MPILRCFSILTLTLALAACETPEQRFERMLPAAEKRCSGFGHKKGTEGFKSCVETEVRRMEDKEDAELQEIANAFESATPKPTTCYTTGYGFTATTTCY